MREWAHPSKEKGKGKHLKSGAQVQLPLWPFSGSGLDLENTKLEACLALALPRQCAGQKSKQRLNVVRCGPTGKSVNRREGCWLLT